MSPSHISTTLWRSLTLVCSVLCLWLAGCGDGRPDRVAVSGKVLIDGQPLTRGTIRLIAADARPASANIGPDGRFTLYTFGDKDGAVLGTHGVEVVSREVLNGTSQKWWAPKKYIDAATSKLTVTITEPTNELVINLSWEGGKPFVENFGGSGKLNEGL